MFENSKTGSAWKSTILISEHCEINGEISFTGELIIHGKVDGCIHSQPGSKALVRVQDGGMVNGDIHSPNVIINGTVVGDIHSERHIELAAKAKVKGTIHYNLLEAVKGSAIDGSLVPTKKLDDVPSSSGNADAAQTAVEQVAPKENEPKEQAKPSIKPAGGMSQPQKQPLNQPKPADGTAAATDQAKADEKMPPDASGKAYDSRVSPSLVKKTNLN